MRPLVGMRGRINDSWDWEIAAWHSEDRDHLVSLSQIVNATNLSAALRSSDPSIALNPFSAVAASSDILASIFSSPAFDFKGQAQTVTGFFRGSLENPFGNPIQLVVGGEYNNAKVSDNQQNAHGEQSGRSAFGELRVPLLGQSISSSAPDRLVVSGALRYDDYDGFGGRWSPQLGIEWRPTQSFLLRGAGAKAYRAPTPFTLSVAGASFTTPVSHPRRGNETNSTVTVLQGGNPNLKPELGNASSLGFVWSLPGVYAPEVALTAWKIEQKDRVTLLLPQVIVNFESVFPGRIVRGPDQGGLPGPILSVNRSYLNFGKINVSGIDFDAGLKFRTDYGLFSPRLTASYTK